MPNPGLPTIFFSDVSITTPARDFDVMVLKRSFRLRPFFS